MTGAEMVVKTLEKNGVKVVFGYPGAANCPIIDKLSFSSIKHILTRNEQGAATQELRNRQVSVPQLQVRVLQTL